MTVQEWENSRAISIMSNIDTTLWIPFSHMTEEEKKANPKAETCEGYLKTIPMKEAWKSAWGNWSEENRKVFTDLEHFSRDIFLEITGIDVNEKTK